MDEQNKEPKTNSTLAIVIVLVASILASFIFFIFLYLNNEKEDVDTVNSSVSTVNKSVTTVIPMGSLCVDLEKTIVQYEGILETETGDSVVYGNCTPPESSRYITVSEPGRYQLELVQYNSAAKMILVQTEPTQQYINTWHGKASNETYNLGSLDNGDHIGFANIAFHHGNAYGPFYTNDYTTYNITQNGRTQWDILMDEGVHLDSGYNDVILRITRVGN